MRLDHIVIVVDDLDRAIADYTELGFTVVPGGEHTQSISRNALIAFQDGSYLELFAFNGQPPAEHRFAQTAREGGGLAAFALLPDDVTEDLEAARSRGLVIEGPIEGGRLRPDGKRIVWQLGIPQTTDLPFLCGDVTPRMMRVPDGAALRHENGVQGVVMIGVLVEDLEVSAQRYSQLLGIDVPIDDNSADINLHGSWIMLKTPESERYAQALSGGKLHMVALRVGRPEDLGPLDEVKTHGARLFLTFSPGA